MSRKSDPNKQGMSLRIHQPTIDNLRIEHPKHIAKTGKMISFIDFLDKVIAAGLKSIKKAKY